MMYLIIFLMFFNLSSTEQKPDKFFIEDKCLNIKIIEIIKNYFATRQCLTLIYLSQNMYIPNEFFSFSNLPQVIKRKNENNFKLNMNITYRPRRDFYTINGVIVDFCEERLEAFLLFSPTLHILSSYAFSNTLSAFLNPKAYIFIYTREFLTAKQLSLFFVHLWHVYRTPHISVTCCTCAHVYSMSWARNSGFVAYRLENVPVEITKKVNQLHGFPFRTCMFPSVMAKGIYSSHGMEYEGVDRMLVDLLAEKMNFTKIVVSSPKNEAFGRRQPDGSFNGALGLLVTGNVDMASVGFFAMDYQTRDVEPTQGVQVDDLCVVVHKANEVPPWLRPVRFVGFEVCVALGLVYLGVAGVWIAIRRFKIPLKQCDTSLMFLNAFRLMLLHSIPRLSNTSSEQIFFAFCAAAFVTLAGTFQGSLVTVYSTQFFYKDINTLADLAQTKIPILTRFESFKEDIFTNESNPTREKLKEMVQIYNGVLSINTIVATTGDVAGLSRRSSMDLDDQTMMFRGKSGHSLLHLVKECIRTYHLTYMLPRASALSPRINEIILRAHQAGFFEKWYTDMAANNTKSRDSKTSRRQGENVALSLVDLQLAMYGLGAGMSASFITFVFELIHVRICLQFSCFR